MTVRLSDRTGHPVPPRADGAGRPARVALTAAVSHDGSVFFFFSNRLGCLGSILVSLVVTAVLVILFF